MTVGQRAAIIFIYFTLLHGLVSALNCSSPSPESLFSALEKNLFPQKLVRPVKNFSDPINITIEVTVVAIIGVNEKQQALTTSLWQVLEWDIEGFSWDEKECGTHRVSVPREKLWIPDIVISEIMDDDDDTSVSPYVYLDNKGHVFDDKPIRVVSSCLLGIYTFPFDVQTCTLTFGSYIHFETDIRLVQGATAEEILEESRMVSQTNGEWEITNIKIVPVELELSVGNYSNIEYTLIMRRRPMVYVVNLLIPSCFLVTVDLFSFLLPPQNVDRASFKMTLILGYTVFLLIMNDLLPITGETTPLISTFFSISLALMVTSLLETVLVTNIQFTCSHSSAVPHWIRVLVLRYIAIIVFLRPIKMSNRITTSTKGPIISIKTIHMSAKARKSSSGGAPAVDPTLDPVLVKLRNLSRDLAAIRLQVDRHIQDSKMSEEWQMVAIVIDRLLFCLYLAFISGSFITIISIWIWNNLHNT